jgi:hypothetical protein
MRSASRSGHTPVPRCWLIAQPGLEHGDLRFLLAKQGQFASAASKEDQYCGPLATSASQLAPTQPCTPLAWPTP